MSTDERAPAAAEGANRRLHPRIPAVLLPSLSARVVGGPSVRLLDVSRRGARLETSMHLRPGRSVSIRFVVSDATVTLTGAVVRSSVAVVETEDVKYHTALSFAEDFDLCEQMLTEPLPTDQSRPAPGTQYDGAPDPASTDHYTVIVTGVGEEPSPVHASLADNSW